MWIVYYIAAILYFVPWAVAAARKHRNVSSIFATNLFFGWTGFGWLFALIWSLSGNVKDC